MTSTKLIRQYARELGLLNFSYEIYQDVHRDKTPTGVHYRTRRYFRLKINYREHPATARAGLESLKFFIECNYPGARVRIYTPSWQIGHSQRRNCIALAVTLPVEVVNEPQTR